MICPECNHTNFKEYSVFDPDGNCTCKCHRAPLRIRYEPIMSKDVDSSITKIGCRNALCYLIPNSKFIVSPFFDDSGRHDVF